jgi:hypothetical protein
MRIAQVVAAVSLVVAVGTAVAQEPPLQTIEVRAEETQKTMVIACTDPATPNLKEVERVLAVSDPAQAPELRTKLMEVAAEACAARQPRINVSRTASGSLTWKPAQS